MIRFVANYGIFIIGSIAIVVFVSFFIGLFWDEVLRPTLFKAVEKKR